MAALVYVVDDEKVISTTLAAILRGSGFDAIPFTDPLEALLAAEDRVPDLLITDVMMPALNGVDLGVQFKAIHPETKVLLFSGQAETSDLLSDARKAGHDFELLTKPVHPTDLLKAIRELTAP
jgi:DNA-binding response OmpR family regulator